MEIKEMECETVKLNEEALVRSQLWGLVLSILKLSFLADIHLFITM
jgi:hypothetical protein